MSTLVMVEKNGIACMAAETLTSYGSRKQSGRYVKNADKIVKVNHSYVGIVGWCAHQTVLQSAFANGLELPEVSDELELFEFARVLHQKLKDDYFLNTGDDDDAYESTQMDLFIMNRHGLFGLYPDRFVEHVRRFAATGSGARYALGAMYAAYEQELPADEIARLGVEAGVEFDHASQGPVTLRQIELKDWESRPAAA